MPLPQSLKTAFAGGALTALLLGGAFLAPPPSEASSHREAPLIADDPLADNTDVYAFRSPDNPSTVTLVANYIPFQLPEGGPNYNHFGEDVRYEIHVKNQTSVGALGTATDDITYRFTFTRVNEDPSTFFLIRLGKENLNTTYKLEKKVGQGGFQTIIAAGATPPPNVGPRSINSAAGLNTDYETLTTNAITTASTGEKVFAGPRDDPFFVDLGGVFDLGGIRDQYGDVTNPDNARDGVAGLNVHSLVLQIPITSLQKNGQNAPANILDGDYVIGVWASASRPQITTLSTDGTKPTYSNNYVQVSRLGMPLTNEAIIPIGEKDRWNYTSPYSAAEQTFAQYFVNPELALYMGGGQFAAAVPGLSNDLRVQQNTYPALNLDGDGNPANAGSGLNFTNGNDGAFALLPLIQSGAIDITGTAFAVPTRPTQPGVPTALIGDNEPRRLDILPIFYFGVPNLAPYQLVTGKTAGPLSPGKPFINNFLPLTSVPNDGLYGGDMLRLNMAVPPTPRGTMEYTDWARLGLIRAAAIGITAPPFNTTTNLEFIPHMDGFPNGRRLEDDITVIELQAVGGLVLAAVGLPFDDATAANYSDFGSPFLFDELAFLAGPVKNDVALRTSFPYLANPFNGYSYVKQLTATAPTANFPNAAGLGIGAPQAFILDQSFPNPARGASTIRFQTATDARDVTLAVYDVQGRLVQTLASGPMTAGTHEARWNASGVASGTYVYRLTVDGTMVAARRATVVR